MQKLGESECVGICDKNITSRGTTCQCLVCFKNNSENSIAKEVIVGDETSTLRRNKDLQAIIILFCFVLFLPSGNDKLLEISKERNGSY